MKKFLVFTTISSPTIAVKNFANLLKDWTILVVTDKKTPDNWNLNKPNVVLLDIKKQSSFDSKLSRCLPFNSYTRKNLGYLYAIRDGADLIAESDDDNIPYKNWIDFNNFEKEIVKGRGFINIYSLFTNKKVWPRGFPLSLINDYGIKDNFKVKKIDKELKIGIWQLLADKDPDVDAVYRLVFNKKILFKKNKGYILDKGIYCPLNSQNTIFSKEVFSLMYLPSYVSMRATDIYRGFIAQAILQKSDYFLYFGSPTVFQERNPHDYMKDFRDEIEVYLNGLKIIEILSKLDFQWNKFSENLKLAYKTLIKEKIFDSREYELLEFWLEDIEL
jgi:hypothetical protein